MSKFSPRLVFGLALILFLAAVFLAFRGTDLESVFSQATVTSIALVLLLGLIHSVLFGLLLNVGYREQYGLRLDISEVLFLPQMMNLFIYILPIKGGLLFQIFYMKQRHQLDLSKAYSLGLMFFLVSLAFTLCGGMALVFYLGLVPGAIFNFLLLIALGLFMTPLLLKLIPAHRGKKDGLPTRLHDRLFKFVDDVRGHLLAHMNSPRLWTGLTVVAIPQVIVNALLYQQSAVLLGFETTFLSMVLVSLVLNVILLLRVLPGNLGIQELLIGVVFAAAGFSLEQGLLVALVIRCMSVFLAGTLGVVGLYSNLKLMHSRSVRSLVRNVSEAQSP